jgi:hypothetical protein
MNQTDFIALEYKLRHAKSKKAVIESYPELKGKTISQVNGLIAVSIFIRTGKDLREQAKCRLRRRWAVLNGYRKRAKHG